MTTTDDANPEEQQDESDYAAELAAENAWLRHAESHTDPRDDHERWLEGLTP